ncbi:Lipase 3 [Folsomia candida]|uniref:Lipase 3 n=1 Tax=Folsomia candida TaxID=158441 RepID=A0A226D263_FOLCA|nr:Lipase 3 [Folsomia candida]
MLADAGFDVFIANCRGNKYSQGHADATVTTDNVKYWEFSFHEMGVYDNPAIIEMVTNVTGVRRMYYVGHSMGGTSLAIMLSERPEYNERISTAFLLAPALYLGSTLKYLQPFFKSVNYYQYSFNKFVHGKLDAYKSLKQAVGRRPEEVCLREEGACETIEPNGDSVIISSAHFSGFCGNLLFLGGGYDAPQTNYTTFTQALGTFPETTSTKTLTHFFQFIKSNTFCQFNYGFSWINRLKYGKDTSPCYNLDRISAPLVVYWGQNDFFIKWTS